MVEPQIEFRRIHNDHGKEDYGLSDFNKKKIYINLLTNANPVHTYIHEILHLEHEDWSEIKVVKETTHIWKNMGMKERFELFKKLFDRKYVGGRWVTGG